MNHKYLVNSNEAEAQTIKELITELYPTCPIIGCTDIEIELLETTLNTILPTAYKIFLRFFGHGNGNGSGYFFDDADSIYEYIKESTLFARELIQEIRNENHNLSLDIPKEFIVIASLYNEYFYLLNTLNDLPYVCLWHRTSDKIIARYNSIWILIKNNIR